MQVWALYQNETINFNKYQINYRKSACVDGTCNNALSTLFNLQPQY